MLQIFTRTGQPLGYCDLEVDQVLGRDCVSFGLRNSEDHYVYVILFEKRRVRFVKDGK